MDGFLLGSLIKVYDDVTDNKLPVSPNVIEMIKVGIVFLTVLTLQKSFTLSLGVAIMLFGAYIVGQVDDPFWVAVIPISGLLCIRTYSSIPYPLFTLFWLTLVFVGIFIEEWLFPEEYSVEKLVARMGVASGSLLGIHIPLFAPIRDRFGSSGDAAIALGSAVGYFGTSSIFQMRHLIKRKEDPKKKGL